MPVFGDIIPGGAQAVAVENSAHDVAVGKEDGGGAVPWLHHGGIVVVKIPLLSGHPRIVAPRLRDGNHHRQGQGNAVHHEKFQGVVQHGGVGAAFPNHRQNLVHVRCHAGRLHGFLPRQHPVGIAPDGVDFAVVENQSIGVRPLPAGGGVGGESGVNHGNGAFVAVLLQIGVKLPQLVYQEHPLIYNCSGGEGAHIGAVTALLKYPPDDIQLPVKVQPLGNISGATHKALVDGGHGLPRSGTQHLRRNRNLPPAQKGHTLLAAHHLQ